MNRLLTQTETWRMWFNKQINSARKKLDKAKAAGDEATVKEIKDQLLTLREGLNCDLAAVDETLSSLEQKTQKRQIRRFREEG